jgi:hypothetical protein
VVLIVVAQDQPLLYQHLRWGFATERGVRVVLDRRSARRRERVGARVPDRRGTDRRRLPAMAAELRARGFVILPTPTLQLAQPSSPPGPGSVLARSDGPEPIVLEPAKLNSFRTTPVSTAQLPTPPKPGLREPVVEAPGAGSEVPAEPLEAPEVDAEWDNPLTARLAARLMESAVVELERAGRRYPALRDTERTRAWRCGSCETGLIVPRPEEFLPSVGRVCLVCQAKIVRAEVVHPWRRTPGWRRFVDWALGRRRGA